MAGVDFELASAYRALIAKLLSNSPDLARRLSSPGPFLIAFKRPLAEVQRATPAQSSSSSDPVLFVDMSEAAADAIPIYVKAFRASVQTGRIDADANLTPLRARFADLIVRLNGAIPFIADAYAGIAKVAAPTSAGKDEKKK